VILYGCGMNRSTQEDTMTTTATRTEQVQAQDVRQSDLIQMGAEGDRAFFREVLQVEVATFQLTGRRVRITVADSSPKGEQTMTDLLPFLTLTRVAV
jgi:hypothetical protein